MGTLKLVFGIFVMVAAVYLIAMLAPPFFSNYQFEDAIRTEAQMDTYTPRPKTHPRLRFQESTGFGCSGLREQIKVQRSGSAYNGSVSIEAPYTYISSLPGYPLDLDFDPSSTNRSVF